MIGYSYFSVQYCLRIPDVCPAVCFFLRFGEMREKILTMKVRTDRRVANLLIYFFTISSGNGLIKNMDMKKSKMLISRLSLRKALFNSV